MQFGITSGTARNFCFKRIGFNQWSNLGRPLFLVVFFFSFIPLLKSQKGLSKGSETLHELLSKKNIRIPLKKKPRTLLYLGGQRELFAKLVLETLSNKNRRISHTPKNRDPAQCYIWADKGGYFQKLTLGS